MKKITKASYRKIAFFAAGIGSLVWFLIRVIPKPSRAAYPCMRAAAPVASAFVLYLLGLFATAAFFKKSKRLFSQSRHLLASVFLLAGIFSAMLTTATSDKPLYAQTAAFDQPGNAPIGTAMGVNPGRVVMIHDPNATNENKGNTRYYLSENNNQVVIDQMVSAAIQLLTGATTDAAAWDSIFIYYNKTHDRTARSYLSKEKIFIKINTVSNYSNAHIPQIEVAETSPQVVLSVLHQLHDLGVPEGNIYVGDPMRPMYDHCFNMWDKEFPNVHYLSHSVKGSVWEGREGVSSSSTAVIHYSDGDILKTQSGQNVTTDNLYTIFEEADYIINLAALKAHARAGVTMFAKNHFGSHTRNDAFHLHNGLVAPNEYNNVQPGTPPLYRTQVDLMAHKLLGGKTLFYLMDALWAGWEAIKPPTLWVLPPFNCENSGGDWTSAIIASQDPVAVESVGFDLLRNEYDGINDPVYQGQQCNFPNMQGVDDYLHQAADPNIRPQGITYNPNNSTPLVTSLGVHEHWNNATNKQYTRNLRTGNGIELIMARTWLGHSTDWNVSTNWSGGGVPGSNDYAYVYATIDEPIAKPNAAYPNQPVISASTTATCGNLSVMPGASLAINAGQALTVNGNLSNKGTLTIKSTGVNSNGSLIVKGASSGNVTYERSMPAGTTVWHYVSSPVSLSSPSTGSFYGWDEESGKWDESPIITTINPLVSGRGYTLVGGSGSVSFTGPIVTAPFTVRGTAPYDDPGTYANDRGTWGGGGWNLLGNPFTSAMSATAFITENGAGTSGNKSLDPNYNAVYIYNGNTYTYIGSQVPGYPNAPGTFGDDNIQAGQGFFVLANYDGVDFRFTPGMQTTDISVPMTKSAKAEESPWPGLLLKVKYGDKENSTLVVYNENMTAGLDPGYDVGLYSAGSDVEIYTSLVEKGNSVSFARQALPIASADTIIVPVGIDSEKGGEVTFSAYTVPLGNNRFWLEDRLTGSVTELGAASYSAVIPANTYGTGRFYLKAAKTITGIQPVIPGELGVRMWVSSWKMLSIEGEVSDRATCAIYDISGHKVFETQLTEGNLNTVSVPAVANGIYVVRVTDGNKTATKKVFL